MLDTTIVSTFVVVISTPNDWITPTQHVVSKFQQLSLLTLLVKFCWCKIDNVPFFGTH
jgi:hypothetical protein